MKNNNSVDDEPIQYVGFWVRFVASVIDSIIVAMIAYPILYFVYGGEYFNNSDAVQGISDFIINYIFPIIAIILFWIYKSATPGKMVLSVKIVDEKTGGKLSVKQCIIRYIGYYVSLIPLGLGFFWVAWDDK